MLTQKQTQWLSIIEDWQASNLSQTEFCRQQQIKLQTFHYYRAFFKKREQPKPTSPRINGSFVQLDTPLNNAAPSATLDLQIGEVALRINQHTDPAFALQWVEHLLGRNL